MKNKIENKGLINSALLYTVGNFFIKGVNFFTIPIFTRILTVNDYGVNSIYLTWSSILAIFMGLGIQGTIGSAKSNLNEKEYREYLSSTLFLATISFLIISLITIIFSDNLSRVLGLKNSILFILVIHSFFTFVINFASAKYTFDQEPKKYLKVSLIVTLINVILSIILVLNLNSDKYMGKIYGGAVSSILVGLILYYKIIKQGRILISQKYWKFCIPIAIPLIFHNLSHLILNQADRIMLQQFTNDGIVGMYSFVYNIGIMLNIVNMSINSAWVAWYFEALKNNFKDEIKERARGYIFIFSVLTAMFMLGSTEIVKILSPREYWEGIKVLPLIILGYYFVFLYTFAVNYEFYKKKTNFIAIGTFVASIINIGINFYFIPKIGIYAAALSTLIAYIVLFILHEFIVRIIMKHKDFSIKYYIKSLAYISIIYILNYVFKDNLIIRWIIILICLCSSIYLINKKTQILNKVIKKQ